MIDSWNSIELASLSFEFRSWKIHLLIFLLIFLFGFNHCQFPPHYSVNKLVLKNIRFRFFFVFFNNFHFFSPQVIFRLFRKNFSWIFVFRHSKFSQKCRFRRNNLEFKHFGFRHFGFRNFRFFKFKFRPEDLEKIFNQRLNSSMFRFLNFWILIAFVQFSPWTSTRNEKRMWRQHDKKQIEDFSI